MNTGKALALAIAIASLALAAAWPDARAGSGVSGDERMKLAGCPDDRKCRDAGPADAITG